MGYDAAPTPALANGGISQSPCPALLWNSHLLDKLPPQVGIPDKTYRDGVYYANITGELSVLAKPSLPSRDPDEECKCQPCNPSKSTCVLTLESPVLIPSPPSLCAVMKDRGCREASSAVFQRPTCSPPTIPAIYCLCCSIFDQPGCESKTSRAALDQKHNEQTPTER